MGERAGTPELGAPELCDFCGAVIEDGTELYALVADSSATHVLDRALDGQRLVSACTPEHLRVLLERYRVRPFAESELWAGTVYRAVAANPGRRIDDDVLVELTGLTVEQIHAGIAWHNDRARMLREHRD